MVGAAIQVPIEEDSVAWGDVGVIPPAPLSVRLEPGDALGLAGGKARLGKAHLAVTPGYEASAPLHAGIKAVPAPIGLAAHVAHLAFGDVHHRLIAGPGAVDKLHTGQTLGIAGVGGPAAEDQGLVAQRLPVHLVHFQLIRRQQLQRHGGDGLAGEGHI